MMDTNSIFLKLRIALDNAITYGSKKRALELARQGLAQARRQQIHGEVEYFLAQRHIIKEEFAGAIEHLDKAITLNPHDGAAYNDRALCMVELGIIDEAMRYFDKGIEVEPDYATIYHNKGWLLNNIGRHTEAIGCFRTALRLDPDRPVTYDNLADAERNLGHYAAALESYRRVLAMLEPGRCRKIRAQIGKEIRILESELRPKRPDTRSH
jgi:tetratricopeptide (TPR) repeat protein